MVALVISATTTVAACGSSSSSGSSSSAVQQSCTAVTDVLADGPDPDADPLGYAQAQILPLRQLKISDPGLNTAVQNLASAYQSFSSGTGTGQSAMAVDAAQNAVNAICPGAAQ